jgi:hypothetical protein
MGLPKGQSTETLGRYPLEEIARWRLLESFPSAVTCLHAEQRTLSASCSVTRRRITAGPAPAAARAPRPPSPRRPTLAGKPHRRRGDAQLECRARPPDEASRLDAPVARRAYRRSCAAGCRFRAVAASAHLGRQFAAVIAILGQARFQLLDTRKQRGDLLALLGILGFQGGDFSC